MFISNYSTIDATSESQLELLDQEIIMKEEQLEEFYDQTLAQKIARLNSRKKMIESDLDLVASY